jgi:hypothetical protein
MDTVCRINRAAELIDPRRSFNEASWEAGALFGSLEFWQTALDSDYGESSMRDAYGPRKLKWALEWPVTIHRSPSVNDNPPMSISNVGLELVALGGAIVLGLVLVTFYAAFGF